MKGQKDTASQGVINDIQNRMNAHMQKQNGSSWRGMTIPDSMKSYTVDGEFNFRNFVRNRSVIGGIVLAILGIIIALASICIPEGAVHTAVCLGAACLSFGGIGKITGYINKQTAKTIHRNKK